MASVRGLLERLTASPSNALFEEIYDTFDHLAEHNLEDCDSLLAQMTPERYSAETLCAILIGTLPVKASLPSRVGFIKRASVVLALEPEGLKAVLEGLT